MNLHRDPQRVDQLAAEYVLGTLRGGARRRFQHYAEDDMTIRRMIDEWQRRLAPMAELAAPHMPSAAVWDAIERQLGFTATRSAPAPVSVVEKPAPARHWFDNLAFWRGWAIGVTVLAAVAGFLALRSLLPSGAVPVNPPTLAQQPETTVSYIAVLNNKDTHPVMLVTWDEIHSSMTLRPLGQVDLPAGRAMELWGIPASGHPVSLGLLPNSANGKVTAGQQKPEDYAALAVSIEPPGGSPDHNAPSGPVVYSGKLLPVT
jgi:anti-sigma-K factor RskA